MIQKICKRLQLRQQVIATAITFFRRFYLRNGYCDTDPPLVAAACCYVASKAEETPLHVKVALSEARVVFAGESAMPAMSVRSRQSGHVKADEVANVRCNVPQRWA